METDGTKQCSRCGRVLPLDEFYKRSMSKDGLQSICKSCSKSVDKERYNKRKCRQEPSDNPLASFKPRQLMEELARRGYKGKLTYTHIIDIENL